MEVAESLTPWVQNKQRIKQQNRDSVTDTNRCIYYSYINQALE